MLHEAEDSLSSALAAHNKGNLMKYVPLNDIGMPLIYSYFLAASVDELS